MRLIRRWISKVFRETASDRIVCSSKYLLRKFLYLVHSQLTKQNEVSQIYIECRPMSKTNRRHFEEKIPKYPFAEKSESRNCKVIARSCSCSKHQFTVNERSGEKMRKVKGSKGEDSIYLFWEKYLP